MAKRSRTSRRLILEELEPRQLLSADLIPLPSDPAPLSDSLLGGSIVSGILTSQPADAAALLSERNEVVFVDPRVPDHQDLVADLARNSNSARRFEIIVLDPDRDGIVQVTEALADRVQVDAVHFITHGRDGAVQLGSSWLDAKSLASNIDAVASWGHALKQDGDLLFYGCDLAGSAEGRALIDWISVLTQTDVAASVDATGSAILGANWTLEYQRGAIEAEIALSSAEQATWSGVLPATNLTASSPWTTVLEGANFDFANDTQAASGADLIGSDNHGALYTNYDDAGTPGTQADDLLAFRVRVGGDNSSTLSGVVLIGIDANGDGALDAFVGVDNQGSGNFIRIWDTGAGANNSPSTTTISTTGYVYAQTAANYDYSAVSSTNDPDWDGSTDLNANGKADRFLSFQLPFQDLVTFLDTQGIGGVTKDTPLRYIFATSTQNNAINSDIGGVNGGVSSSATWDALGAFSPPLSASNIFPTITSNGGGDTAAINVLTGTQSVTAVIASDANGDAITYSITGGLDQSRFTINAVTGALIFTTAPNYYAPADSNSDNVYEVQVTASDGKGGTDVQTLSVTVTEGVVDNTAPSLILTVPLDDATGVPTNSNIKLVFDEPVKLGASGTITIWETRNPSDQVFESFSVATSPRITVSGNTITIDPTGDFSNNRDYYVIVGNGAITDLKGNAWTGISASTTFNFKTGNSADITATNPPTLDLLAASDTGASSTDNLTSDATPTIRVILNGTGSGAPVAGDTVKLFLNAIQIDAAVLSATDITNGYVDITLSGLGADGAKSLTATVTDFAGNASAPSTALVVTLDTTATVTVSEPISGGFVNSGESTSVAISGTALGIEAGQTVTVTVSDTSGGTPDVTGTATVGASGTWTVAGLNLSGLVDGNLTVSAAVSDLAGNTANDTAAVVLDVTAPATPTVTGISDDNGASATDELTNDQTLFFNGTAEANTTVEVFVDGISVGTAPVDGGGAWAFDYTATTLAAGSYNVTARALDAAGNQSAPSAALPITIDTTPPGVSILGAPADHDGATLFGVTIEFAEDVTGFAIGDISASGATLSSFVAVDGNTYTVQVTPTGTSNITLDVASDVAQDNAGNANSAATQVTVPYADGVAPTVDSILRQNPPAALTNADTVTFRVTFSEDVQNVSAADFALSGTGATGAAVLSVNPVSGSVYDIAITGITNNNGTLNLDFAGGQDIADLASNALTNTTPSSEQEYILDNLAPAAPTVNSQITNSTTPTITGTATVGVGEVLTVLVDGVTYTVGDGNLSLAGANWTLVIPPANAITSDGTYDVTATVTDAATNATVDATSGELIIDSIAPTFAAQSFNYAENQASGATVATVVASDDVAVTAFVFNATGTNTSADGTAATSPSPRPGPPPGPRPTTSRPAPTASTTTSMPRTPWATPPPRRSRSTSPTSTRARRPLPRRASTTPRTRPAGPPWPPSWRATTWR